jgi:hypothetical protein
MSCSIPLVPAAHNSRVGPDEGISCVPVSSQRTTQRRSPLPAHAPGPCRHSRAGSSDAHRSQSDHRLGSHGQCARRPPTPRRGEPIAAHRQGATALASAQDPLVLVAGLTHGSVGSIPIPGGTDACVHGSAGPGSPGRARAAGQVPGDSREARDVPAKRRGQPPIEPRNFRVIMR